MWILNESLEYHNVSKICACNQIKYCRTATCNFSQDNLFHRLMNYLNSSRGCICVSYQKKPPRGVPGKRCFENRLQIYKRTLMLKYDFNKVAKQLCWNHTSAWVFSYKFAAYFQNTFSWEHPWATASGSFKKKVWILMIWIKHYSLKMKY